MNSILHYRGLFALFLALAVGFVGCDSNDDDDPDPIGGQFCAENSAAFGCVDSGVVYDTLGADVNGRTIIEVEDEGGGIGGAFGTDARTSVTWSSDFTYVLDGLVFVNEGQTLEVEPGTIIRGRPGQGRNSSALVVARGGTIEANGEATAPIIMTALNDDVEDPNDLVQDGAPIAGEWGGLIVLGAGPTNIAVGETPIEGIEASDVRGLYGGNNANDNSGTIRYVSIRHGGTLIGEGNEINGFTLGAVGAGTTIEYVEVFANQDDGVEWFGGTAQAKYLVVSYSGDDMYDYDLGYDGINQYVFGLQDDSFGDNGGEFDGGSSTLGGEAGEAAGPPFATPVFANMTLIGSGLNAANSSRAMTLRDNAGGQYWRSIFYDFQNGVRIEDRDDAATEENEGGDSRERAEEGDIAFVDAVFDDVVSNAPSFDDVFGFYEEVPAGEENFDPALLTGPVLFQDAGLTVTRGQGGALSLTPSGLPAPSVSLPGGFLDETDYIGAFGAENWIDGWTALSQFNSVN
jgi:hypothetical protein